MFVPFTTSINKDKIVNKRKSCNGEKKYEKKILHTTFFPINIGDLTADSETLTQCLPPNWRNRSDRAIFVIENTV
jgi:hypothetical protein